MILKIPIENNWKEIIQSATGTESYQALTEYLNKEYKEHTIYPKPEDLWTAFQWTDYQDVKVVILGQDPYHGKNQAHGLSFSVQPLTKIPPSLRNIYKELESDLGITPVDHGYLKKWADEGVFLINTVMTVREGEAGSHSNKGWEELTDMVITSLNKTEKPIIFILWGAQARKKRNLIDEDKHYVLTSPHPSPLSAYRGFFGSKPFSKTNQLLVESGQKEIDWNLHRK